MANAGYVNRKVTIKPVYVWKNEKASERRWNLQLQHASKCLSASAFQFIISVPWTDCKKCTDCKNKTRGVISQSSVIYVHNLYLIRHKFCLCPGQLPVHFWIHSKADGRVQPGPRAKGAMPYVLTQPASLCEKCHANNLSVDRAPCQRWTDGRPLCWHWSNWQRRRRPRVGGVVRWTC